MNPADGTFARRYPDGTEMRFNAAGHPHVIDLADAGGIVAGVLEMLGPGRPRAEGRSRARVAQHSRRMRVIARQERRPRRAAIGRIAERVRETGARGGETIDVRRSANLIAVARQRGCREVVGDDEQDVRTLLHAPYRPNGETQCERHGGEEAFHKSAVDKRTRSRKSAGGDHHEPIDAATTLSAPQIIQINGGGDSQPPIK